MKHFNGLNPAEAERLALLAEECGEVIQMIGKVLRHGYESCHPNGGETNREELQREIGDIKYVVDLMIINEDILEETVKHYSRSKETTFWKYQHHQINKVYPN